MLKRALIALLVLATILVVVGLTLPWWLGGVLRWQGSKYGASFAAYETVGYGQWAVSDLRIQQSGWTAQVDRLQAPHPWVLWQQRGDVAAKISLGEVVVQIDRDAENTDEPGTPFGPRDLYNLLEQLARELPALDIESARVELGGDDPIQSGPIRWGDRHLKITTLAYRQWSGDFETRSGDSTDPSVILSLAAPDQSWRLQAEAPRDEMTFALEGHWQEQPVTGEVAFDEQAWSPEHVWLDLADWPVPATRLGIEEGYDTLRGSTSFRWQESAYVLDTRWQSRTIAGSTYPPIDITAKATGDAATTQVEALAVDLPGLQMLLDEPLRFSHLDATAASRSRFSLQGDLATLPWLEGTGRVTGLLDITSEGTGWPTVEFALRTEDLSWREWQQVNGTLAGDLQWPRWTISASEFQDDLGNRLSLVGEGEASAVAGVEWSVELTDDLLERWVDRGWELAAIQASGTLAGTWPDISHSGNFTTDGVKAPGFLPLDVKGDWQGQGRGGSGQVELNSNSGSLALDGSWLDLGLELQGRLTHAGEIVVETTGITTLDLSDDLRLERLRLEGPRILIESSQATAKTGDVRFSLDQPNWNWMEDWLEIRPQLPLIRQAEGSINWADDRLSGALDFDGDVSVAESQSVSLKFSATSSGDGLEISAGQIGWQDSAVATVTGGLPVKLTPHAPFWALDRTGEINAQLILKENQAVWQEVNKLTKINVKNPRLEVAVAGTWNRPRGQGSLGVDQITFATGPDDETNWPVVSEVAAQLVDDGSGLVVDPLTARIDGQLVSLKGEVPFTPEEWARFSNDPLAYFRDEGRGELQIPRAELAAFAKFLPAYLVPTGGLEVGLSYSLGEGTNGRIVLEDVVSKPLGPLGVLQNINADLRFENRTMEIETVSALMGGQPLSISGSAGWPEGGAVEMELALRGDNLPIVRKTGMLLRSDLDLRIDSTADGAGLVSGEARLRDGLVLVDVRSLVPRGGSSMSVPARRPPYFSVTVPPINQWNLQVRMTGEDFLRLRTPVLNGTGSVRARLEGTLENPRLLGELELRDSDLRLPFARLEVDEAMVRLTEANPYDPEIWLEANGQRLGYDLRLELEGRASEPQLTLQSSPSLSAEELLMLVMAGVMPNDDTDLVNTDRAMRLGLYFGQGLLGDLFGTDERERLSVSTGEKLSRLGKETYEFEYEIADRWSVVGEYDEFDYYNAALKWRVRPGKPKPTESDRTKDKPEGTDE